MLLFIPIISALVFGWIVYAFPNLLAFTTTVAQWCQNIFFQCLEYLLIIKIFFLWLGFIIVAASFICAALKTAAALIRSHRRIKNLPLIDYGGFLIIKDDKLKTAFTHGLFNPRIYISAGLVNSLDDYELKAVYLHELHHKNRKDPLRFFILSILRNTFFYIPLSMFVEKFIHDRSENKADDAVVASMKEPLSLAAALLKIAGFNKEISGQKSAIILQPASIGGIASPEKRIRRLVEGRDEKINPPSLKTIITSAFISGFLALSISIPLFASFPPPGQCDTTHCDVHMNKLGKDCQNHCEASKHMH